MKLARGIGIFIVVMLAIFTVHGGWPAFAFPDLACVGFLGLTCVGLSFCFE